MNELVYYRVVVNGRVMCSTRDMNRAIEIADDYEAREIAEQLRERLYFAPTQVTIEVEAI